MKKETRKCKSRWKIQDLLADGRCSQAVLDFLTTTSVGKIVPTAEEDVGSEASEWELRERMEREEESSTEAEALGTEEEGTPGKNPRSSFPPPRSWHRREWSRGEVALFLCFLLFVVLFFLLFFCSFLGAHRFFLGTGLGGGQRGVCNEPPCADCRRDHTIVV